MPADLMAAGRPVPSRRAKYPRITLAHRAYVLESGKVVRTAEAGTLLNDDSVRAAYLGGDVGQ
jgi:ABC-type lipopolysaccharide export system ATPase subunit